MSKHAIDFTGVEPVTKQSFKDECNINKIMEKFQRTGAIDHYAKHGASYSDVTSGDLHTAMNIIADADSMFEELPATLRKKFQNDPQQFLDFVQNPDNLEEMRELGLANKDLPSVQPTNTPEPPAPAAPEPTPTTEPSGE